MINCTSYKFGLAITEAAIEARKPMLDLGGLYNTPLQLEMTGAAEAAGVTIVLGCGATPGVTNLMAKRGSQHMDQVDEIHVAFATYRAIAPSPGLLDTVMDEFSPGIKRFYYETHDQLRNHLADFVAAYNFAKRLKTLKGLTPYEYICKLWTKEPHRFTLNPLQQMPGLNI